LRDIARSSLAVMSGIGCWLILLSPIAVLGLMPLSGTTAARDGLRLRWMCVARLPLWLFQERHHPVPLRTV